MICIQAMIFYVKPTSNVVNEYIYILVKRLTENEDVFICYCYETALYIEFHKSVCTVHLTDLGLNILRIFNEVATTN